MTDAREAIMVGRATDGRIVRRPLSPHLQAYKWTPSMAGSILHRVSGVALSAGALMLACWLVAAATSDVAYDGVSSFLRSPFGVLLLLGWVAALWYHFCAGLRHLFWDAGLGFDKAVTNRNTTLIYLATAVLTLLTWIVLFAQL